MPTIRFRFPGGRYHATPWGHHVNEGLVEWPPCPWRLLRALLSCGFSSHRWTEVPDLARSLAEKLAETLPAYQLPRASAAHSRHYMPIGTLDKGREKTTLVFDTWADVGNQPLDVHWDCELVPAEEALLASLCSRLPYLGRAESWVEGELRPDAQAQCCEWNAFPHVEGTNPGPGWEQLSLLAPVPADDYGTWRERAVADALAAHPLPDGGRKPSRKLLGLRARALEPYPTELVDCLTKDTAWWKGHRWALPPGSRRVVYWRRADLLEIAPEPQPARVRPTSLTTMFLALATPSGCRSALPVCTRTLPQAELLHRALVSRAGEGERVDCPELTGRDGNGHPLATGHRHAHILPVDLDGDGHLDHVLIHAAMGLGPAAQRAIRSLQRTWTKGGVGELQVAVAGAGDLPALAELPPPLGANAARLVGDSRVWRSLTPFVAPRYLKRSGRNSLSGQVRAELASRGLPDPLAVEVLPANVAPRGFRHFVRRRGRGGPPPPVDAGHCLRITFATPLPGLIALGYGSHFGLGLFAAVAEPHESHESHAVP